MSISRKYLSLFSKLPRVRSLYYLSNKYSEYCKGNNWHVFEINGEKKFLDTVIQNANPKMIFDVGCNRGDWTNYVINKLPTAAIHCFEPDPKNAAFLQQRFQNNTGVVINEAGAGKEASALQFYQYKNSEWNSFHKWETHEVIGELSVPVVTIDDYCTANSIDEIDLLKIDTEGHDYFVLLGAKQLLAKGKIKFIQFEYGPNYTSSGIFLRAIFELIKATGQYNIYKLHSKGLLGTNTYHESLDEFKLSNFAIIRNDQVSLCGKIQQYWK